MHCGWFEVIRWIADIDGMADGNYVDGYQRE